MFRIIRIGTTMGVLMAFGSTVAMAQGDCSSTYSRDYLSQTLIAGGTCICGTYPSTRPNLAWNETHAGGTIYEKGLATSGQGDAVGTYSFGGDNSGTGNAGSGDHGQIQYAYTGGPSYNWVVDSNPGANNSYRMCAPGTHTPAYLVKITTGTQCAADCN